MLKKYKLIEKVADRAGRETWKAVNRADGKIVAIKFVSVLSFKDAELLEREAQILKQLDCPRIPKYIDSWQDGDRVALVREWIEGEPLSEDDRLYEEAEIINVARQILDILTYLHSKNPPIVYRDIKPSNIVRDKKGQLHLIDFGAVRVSPHVPGSSFTVVGSSGYAPIEQNYGRAEPKSDIYALGMALVFLLTKTHPDELPLVRGEVAWRANISQRLKGIIAQMVKVDVRDRPSASEALAKLDGIALEDDVPAGLRLLVKGPSEETLALAKTNRSLLSPGAEKPLRIIERIAVAGIAVCGSAVIFWIVAPLADAPILEVKELFEFFDMLDIVIVSLRMLYATLVMAFLIKACSFIAR